MKKVSEILENENLKMRIENGETVVLNFKKHYDVIKFATLKNRAVRCDRKTKFGNPYYMKNESERLTVVRNFWLDIKNGKSHLTENDFRELIGKSLVCWCSPLRCHCDALKFVADKLHNGTSLNEIRNM